MAGKSDVFFDVYFLVFGEFLSNPMLYFVFIFASIFVEFYVSIFQRILDKFQAILFMRKTVFSLYSVRFRSFILMIANGMNMLSAE